MWPIKAKLKQVVREEEGTIVKDFGGKNTYVIIYPNTYFVGMSNLGIHNVYRLLNEQNNVVCERAFLPEKKDLLEYKRTKTPILSVESQRPISDFDVIAFSIAYENDISNIKTILELSSVKKGGRSKLIAGGAAVTLNPKLFENLVDEVIPWDFEDNPPSPPFSKGGKERIGPARSVIWTRNTEFGSMHLVEIQRGCPHRCKFCAAPIIYHSFKQFSKDEIIKAIDIGLPHRRKIGLIGGDVLAHPSFEEIAEYIHSKGGTFSPSSIKADRINNRIAELLKISGHKTITLAPETGSEKLRKKIGKDIPDEEFFEAAKILSKHGIRQFKLYFMIGLPGETVADIESIASFVEKFHVSCSTFHVSCSTFHVTVAINPFVPKIKTLFEMEKFAEISDLKSKISSLKKMMAKMSGIKLKAESPITALHEYKLQK